MVPEHRQQVHQLGFQLYQLAREDGDGLLEVAIKVRSKEKGLTIRSTTEPATLPRDRYSICP
jgi:hypothetical protein